MITFLKTIGYVGTWAALFSEGAFFFGIFLPGDSLLFPIGILAGQGIFNLWIMLPGCFLAAFLGNLVGYEIGKRWGPKLLTTKYASRLVKDHHLKTCEDFFEKYGAFTVVISRFIHFARTLVPFMAGMTRMDYKLFVAYSALGAAVWAAGVPLLGYFVGELIPEGSIDKYLLPFIGILILIVASPAIISVIKRRYFSKNV
ncbi:MAG: DedA family protein [Alphaproteobacteria bacterium]|nr:DedA family protein [Alphaproteobacteria bacterium]